MFIDEVKIKLIAWRGWDGLVSWRREKYIPKWGPWGWDGWNGGHIYLQTDHNLNTLSDFRHKKVLKAQDGEKWLTNCQHGLNGEDLVIKVPVGTIVTDAETGELIKDLSEENSQLRIVSGGRGGFWNAHFTSSTRQAPGFAELWDIGEERDIQLELKLVADIGIIGIPSAGKSTIISVLTSVRPKIGDYPFTTLIPNLGVLEHKGKTLVLEDVPGLIEWASQWKGLGVQFLKHIERTKVLLHLLDCYRLDQIFEDYEIIRKELGLFSPDLVEKEEIIILSKADLLDEEMKKFLLSEFKKKYKKKKIFLISAATSEGISELKDFLVDSYTSFEVHERRNDQEEPKMVVYDLKNVEDDDPRNYTIYDEENLVFTIKGKRIEQMVRMTNFDNKEAIMRLYDILEKIGAIKKIQKKVSAYYTNNDITNDFYFEWNDAEKITPIVVIAGREIALDKLLYNLD
jgi:GTPase